MKKFIALLIFFVLQSSYAGLPPTTTKGSADATDITTFKYRFPNFTGTHTGTVFSLGVNSVAGGGTGAATFTSNLPLIGNGAGVIGQGTVSGNTTVFGTTSGALTSGHCIRVDASGNLIDAGAACGTLTTIGAIDGNGAAANGLSISGASLFAQSASILNPGLVNTGTQSFVGAKTFTNNVTITTGNFLRTDQIESAGGLLFIDVVNNTLKDGNGFHQIDWANSQATDKNNHLSVDWLNRDLVDTAAANQLTWSTTGVGLPQLTASLPLQLSAGKIITAAATNLSGAQVTGTLPVAQGGTGSASALTQFGVAYASSTTAEATTAAGTTAQVLQGNAAGAPTWVTPYVATQGQSEGGSHSVQTLEAPYNQATNNASNTYLFETGNKNLLANPGFENVTATTSWVSTKLSGTTFTTAADTSDVVDGKQSVSFATTSATGELSQDVTPPLLELSGVPMVAACRVLVAFSATDVQVCARTGGVDIQCNSVPNTGSSPTWALVPVNFTGPSSGSVGVSVKNTVSGNDTLVVDDCYVGVSSTPQNFGQVSQANWVGSVVITGCSAAFSSAGATTFSDYSAGTSCTCVAKGNVACPATNIPGARVTGGPGEWTVQATGLMAAEGTATANVAYFQTTDGTTTSDNPAQIEGNSSNSVGNGTLTWHMSYPQALNANSIRIQGKGGAGTVNAVTYATTSDPIVLNFYRFPTSSEIAYRPDVLPASWSGTQLGAGGGWSTTSASYADYSVATTSNTVTQLTATNLTCVAEATKLPAITCTPPKAGAYLVCASGTANNSTAGSYSYTRLMDGSTVVNGGAATAAPSNGGDLSFSMCGVDTLSSTASVTWKIQGAASSNTNALTQNSLSPITWSVTALNQQIPAPLLMGSVTSTSTGQEHIERATLNLSGASTCTITSQSGSWISSATAASTICTVNIAAGEFSAAPSCTIASNATGSESYARLNGIPTTSTVTFTNVAPGPVVATGSVNIICMGPR